MASSSHSRHRCLLPIYILSQFVPICREVAKPIIAEANRLRTTLLLAGAFPFARVRVHESCPAWIVSFLLSTSPFCLLSPTPCL